VDVVRNPIYATAVGLLLYGKEAAEVQADAAAAKAGIFGVFDRMKAWFQGNF
jgi:cell division protein FtsA